MIDWPQVKTRLLLITVDQTSTSQCGDQGNNIEIMENRSPDRTGKVSSVSDIVSACARNVRILDQY